MNSQDKSTPKIGIVIPIYNVAKYLRECLDSVANQTYGNFCAVLVNDGSTDFVSNSSLTRPSRELEKSSIDRQQALSHSDFSAQPTNFTQDTRIADLSKNNISQSLQIALEYVVKDSRFVLIDKENGGQSSARNVGIAWFSNKLSLRGQIIDSHEAIQTARHTERSEVSKSRESQTNNESMTKGRINKSRRFTQNQQITNDSQIAKVDSSLTAFAQNDESVDCHDSALPNLAMTAKSVYANATHFMPPQIDYIIFLDSDDFWELDLLEKCVDSALKHNAQIVWFSWKTFYDGIDNPSVNGGGGIHLAWHLWLHTRGRHKQYRLV